MVGVHNASDHKTSSPVSTVLNFTRVALAASAGQNPRGLFCRPTSKLTELPKVPRISRVLPRSTQFFRRMVNVTTRAPQEGVENRKSESNSRTILMRCIRLTCLSICSWPHQRSASSFPTMLSSASCFAQYPHAGKQPHDS